MAYQSDYGTRMANLSMRQGEQEAQRALQRGQTWAQFANIPLNTMKGMVEIEDLMLRRQDAEERRQYYQSMRESQELARQQQGDADAYQVARDSLFSNALDSRGFYNFSQIEKTR